MKGLALKFATLIAIASLIQISECCSGCAAGYECNTACSTLHECYNGFYNPGNTQINCVPCPAGNFCPAKASYTPCPQQLPFSKYGEGQCLQCPAGYACTPGSAATVCAEGTFSLAGDNVCTTCPKGHQCPNPADVPVACATGHFSLGGTSFCSPCNPGYFCPMTVDGQQTCPSGTYSLYAQTSCITCPAGHYCPRTDMAPLDCIAGEYALPGATSCTRCEAGKSCNDVTKAGIDCSAGQFSLSGQTSCTTCPAGYICPNRNVAPTTLCGPGTYSLAGAIQCQDCQPGKQCQYTYVAASGNCAVNYYMLGGLGYCKMCEPGYECDGTVRVPCPMGQYSIGLAQCADCPLGSYCDTNSRAPLTCPAGSYCPINSVDYISCPKGYYCTNPSTAPQACSAGYYSLGFQTACTICPDGFYCPVTWAPPQLCNPGYYTPGTGQTACTKCPAGKYCPGTMSSHLLTTPGGSYSLAGMTYYIYCMPGFTCPSISVLPTKCSLGYTTDFGSTAASCTPCPAGSACPTTSSADVYGCPAGHYSGAQAQYCIQCPAGYSCTSTTPTACASGQFSMPGSSICTSCPTGFYCPYANAPHIFPCPPGTYSGANQIACTVCSPGTACAKRTTTLTCSNPTSFAPRGAFICAACPGGSSCTGGIASPCALGYYSAAGDDTCTECPNGYYCPTLGSYPIPCPAGTAGLGTQKLLCTACVLGKYSAEGAQTCTDCPAGSYCAAPHMSPRICPPGTYSLTAAFTCTPCAPGYYCPAGSTTSNPNACPDGYYCNYVTTMGFGGIGKAPCPAGTYRTSSQNTGTKFGDCLDCTLGNFCPEGTGTPNPCKPGYYCPLRTKHTDQYPCPAGTYYSGTGAQTAATCVACTTGYYCPPGTASPLNCPPGYSCTTNTGLLLNNQITTAGMYSGLSGAAQSCDAGSYCPLGATLPTPCPPGTYRATTGAAAKADCLKCSAGYPCPKYFNTAAQNGITCPTGYYCPSGTEYPTQFPCPAGTYSDATGLTTDTQCLACPAGKGCEPGTNANTNPQKNCLPGFYCPQGSKSPKGVPCPAGSYSNAYGNQAVGDCSSTCDQGYYCVSGSDRVTGECQEGYYCPAGSTNATYRPCPAGTFSTLRMLYSSSQCLTCPMGYYCPLATVVPILCPAGTYNNGYGLGSPSACTTCEGGYYCPIGSTNHIICGKGSYSPPGAQQCYPCIRGYYCSSDTTSQAVMLTNICGAGYFCPQGTGAYPSSAVTCPAGYYCGVNVDQPTKCPPGQTSAAGAGVCFYTPSGSYTPLGSVALPCTPGYYCPLGSWSTVQLACPAGTYNPTTHGDLLADCLPCTIGFYCPTATATPILCPQGYYCPISSTQPTKCAPGTYGSLFGLTKQDDCTFAPEGTYCSLPGLSAPEGLCDLGYFCIKGATSSTPTDGTTGNICPAGGYCEAGSRVSQSCPPGTYNPVAGGRDLSACILCPPGVYCSGEAKSTATGGCDKGYYCPPGSYMSNMLPAAPGNYTLVNQSSQTQCAVGYYNPYYAQSACLPCPVGFYCQGLGNSGTLISCPKGSYCPLNSSLPTPCPLATYNPNFDGKSVADCLPCPQGMYCSIEGLVKPGDGTANSPKCDPGYFCKISSNTKAPAALDASGNFGPCPLGSYCPQGISNPIPCPPGTYSAAPCIYAVTQCLTCPAGYYCTTGGMTTYDGPCAPGYFCVAGTRVPKPATGFCTPGNYCPGATGAKIPCPEGSYQDEFTQGYCKNCPAGFYCPQGTSSLTGLNCPTGYYCPVNTTSSTSNPCPIGTYNPFTNANSLSQCILCDPGYYCAGTGLSAKTGQCNAGYYCTLGSPTNTPPSSLPGSPANHGNTCPLGNYCPVGSAMPILCPGGKYCSTTGLAINQGNCNAGYYCRLGSTSNIPVNLGVQGGEICPPGFYCVAGSDSPKPCPVGTYNPNSGTQALSGCYVCPSGSYCQNAGITTPTGKCNAGYYCKLAAGATIGYTVPDPYQQICPIGYYCPQGAIDKMACIGGYTDVIGQGSCTTCPAGYTCTTTAKTLCQPKLENLSFYCPPGVGARVTCPAGTYNMLDGTSSMGDCVTCIPGYYCPVSSTQPKMIPCQAGYYCKVGGASVATGDGQCPAGFYCPLGTYNPIPCPAGKFCKVKGLSDSILTDTAFDCTAGYICYGQSLSAAPTDGITGSICPSGFYCPSGAKAPIACPISTYRTSTGGTSVASCSNCLNGKTCPFKGLASPLIDCPAGYYCTTPGAVNFTTPCPVGAMCPKGSVAYTVCPDKFYQNLPGQANCISCPSRSYCLNSGNLAIASLPRDCPQGYYCPINTASPLPCPASTFSNRTGLSLVGECDSCIPGYYCQTTALTSPTGKCNAGYYCTLGAKIPNPNDASGNKCPSGNYCPTGTIIPVPCPPGTYNDLVSQTSIASCVKCPAGYFCPLRGATSMDLKFGAPDYYCIAGFRCISGATIPNPNDGVTGYMCAPGYYCPLGTTMDILCPRGYYNPNPGQSSCLQCPAGKLCSTTGLVTYQNCTAGNYCPVGSTIATPCPAGTYSPFQNLESVDQCVNCDPGMYCLGGKIAVDGPCDPGYVCPSKATTKITYVLYSSSTNLPGQCPLGYICPQNSSAPTPCPIGTYNNQAAQTSCTPCPAGMYCDTLATISPVKVCAEGFICFGGAFKAQPLDAATEGGRQCRAGAYCPLGTTVEIPCASGTYEGRSGSSLCQACPAGYYCTSAGGTAIPTPCPVGYYCPAGGDPTICPFGTYGRAGSTALERADQCMPCPSGQYCQNGLISGNCDAGYYCDTGAKQFQDPTKKCLVGHYCPYGTKIPMRCPAGKYNMITSATNIGQCVDCQNGYYCVAGSSTAYTCPTGHYCPPPAYAPTACPPGTYNGGVTQTSNSSCLYCPSGTYCFEAGIADPTFYPCPVGHYCLGANVTNYAATPCPGGTYNNRTGSARLKDCMTCPKGYSCGTGTVNPSPCSAGYYCNGTSNEIICPGGFYCPPRTQFPISCPAAYYCPEGAQIYIKCRNGYYCDTRSKNETICPSGTVGSYNSNNTNVLQGCIQCTPGYYSNNNNGSMECHPCAAGYVCIGGSTTPTPVDLAKEGGQECPEGYYCPLATYDPNPCPVGTYNPNKRATNVSACLKCPANYYNPEAGKTKCISCGSYSNSTDDRSTCTCIGKFRAFQITSKQCTCIPLYIPADGTSANDYKADCQPVIFPRCSTSEVRDPSGNCVSINDCTSACANGKGKRNIETGVCVCEVVDDLETVCDDACRKGSLKISVTYSGEIQMVDPANPSQNVTVPQSALTSLAGNMTCPVKGCKIASVSLAGKDGFSSNYQPTSSLSSAYTAKNGKRLLSNGRLLVAASNGSIRNPLICLNLGDTMMFEVSAPSNYPVYDSNNLLNSNPSFDYSPFTQLATRLKNGEKLTDFAFTFIQAGKYVFVNAANANQIMIIGVMASGQSCGTGNKFIQPISTMSLQKLGVTQNNNMMLAPDWTLIFGLIASILFGTPILIGIVKHFSQSGWNKKKVKKVEYRKVNKTDEYDEFLSRGNDWNREILKAQPNSPGGNQNILLDEDNELISKPNDRERLIIEMRSKENKEGVHEISTDIFRDLYNELQYHTKFVKEEFARKAGMDSDNIKKVFGEVDKLKDLMEDKLQNIAKSYGRGIRLIFNEADNGEGLFVEHEEDKKKEDVKSEESEEEKAEENVEFKQEIFDEIEMRDQQNVEQLAACLREDQAEIEKELKSREKERKDKFVEEIKAKANLTKEEKKALIADYDKSNVKIVKLVMIEEQASEDKLQQMLNQRRKHRNMMQEEIARLEQEKKKIQEEFTRSQQDVDSQKLSIQSSINQEIEKEKAEEIQKLEMKKNEELQNVRKKFQKKLKGDITEAQRDSMLQKFSVKMKALEKELEETRKKEQDEIIMKLDMKRQSRRAEREVDIKRRDKDLKEEQTREINAINAKITLLNDNLKNSQMDDMIKKVQMEENNKQNEAEFTDDSETAILSKQIEAAQNKEKKVQEEMDAKLEEQRKILLEEEKREIKRIQEEKSASDKKIESNVAEIKSKKAELASKLAKCSTPSEKKKLLEDYQKYKSEITEQVNAEVKKQQISFDAKIAERKKKRALKEAEFRIAQEKELEKLKKSNRQEEDTLKRKMDQQKLQREIDKMKMMLTEAELPFAVERLIDEKQMSELLALLRRQLQDKAAIMRVNMEKLLKNKADSVEQVKMSLEAQSEQLQKLHSMDLIKKDEYEGKMQELKDKRENAMKEVEYEYAQKQNDLEERKLMDLERANSEELIALTKLQSSEKQMYMQAFVSNEFLMKILSGDKAKIAQELADYEKDIMESYAKRAKEIEEKKKKIEDILLQNGDKIKELEAQASKMLEEEALRDKKRQEKKKKEMQEKLASKEEELSKQKGITEQEKKKLLEEHQKELDLLTEAMEKERGRQKGVIKEKIQEKLKQKEIAKKQRDEQIALFQKEEEKLLNDKVKEIQKEQGIETEEEKGRFAELNKKYTRARFLYEKHKNLGGVDLAPNKEEENVLKGILESKKKSTNDQNKIDLSFELLLDRLRKLETSVGTITGLQFEQIFAGYLDLNNKLDNITSGNLKSQPGKPEAPKPNFSEEKPEDIDLGIGNDDDDLPKGGPQPLP